MTSTKHFAFSVPISRLYSAINMHVALREGSSQNVLSGPWVGVCTGPASTLTSIQVVLTESRFDSRTGLACRSSQASSSLSRNMFA